VGDITIKNNAVASDVSEGTYTSYTTTSDGKLQFCEKYFSNLKLTSATNSLAQPVNKWKLKSEVIGSYAKSADKTLVIADKNKTLDAVLTGSTYGDYSLSTDFAATTTYALNGVTLATSATPPSTALTKGDVVYVYTNSSTGVITNVAVARYTYAKIDTVSSSLTTSEKDNGAAYRVKLVDVDDNTIGTYYDDHDTSSRKINGFDASTYVADATLAIANGTNGIADSYVIEAVTGTPSAATEGANGSITVGGTKYSFAGTPAGTSTSFSFDKSYDVYATKEGYAIAITGASAADLSDIYYVTGYYREIVGGEARYYAQRVSMDGVVDTVELESGSLASALKTALDGTTSYVTTASYLGLYSFNDKKDSTISAKANDGKLTLIAFTASDAYADFNASASGVYSASNKLPSGGIKVDATSITLQGVGGRYYVNSATKFVAVESYGSNIDVSTSTGGMRASSDYPAIIIVDRDDARTAVAVIIASSTLSVSSATKDVLYLASASSSRAGSSSYTTDLYNMNDGSLIESATITDDINQQGFFTYELTDGVYKLVDGAGELVNGTYDDETGYVKDLVITDVYNKNGSSYMSGSGAVTGGTATISDAKLTGVTIIDNRSDDDKDISLYNGEITTVADLKAAYDAGATITADVYFDDGVTFIAVNAVGITVSDATKVSVAGQSVVFQNGATGATATLCVNDLATGYSVTATSSNTSVVTTSISSTKNAVITYAGAGTATVTVTVKDGSSNVVDTFVVSVKVLAA
jgi:X-X-X-Leu-X-X-Gly heptad repeat protein